jgi:hypothetical protein
LGYQTKVINFSCFAKANGQWRKCNWAIHYPPEK